MIEINSRNLKKTIPTEIRSQSFMRSAPYTKETATLARTENRDYRDSIRVDGRSGPFHACQTLPINMHIILLASILRLSDTSVKLPVCLRTKWWELQTNISGRRWV